MSEAKVVRVPAALVVSNNLDIDNRNHFTIH